MTANETELPRPESGDAVLSETLDCLWFHRNPEWGDQTRFDVFSRLLAKSIRPDGWTKNMHLDLQPKHVLSRRERWSLEALAKLPRGHDRTRGYPSEGPIVVAEYEGIQRLLDGTTRINRWLAAQDARMRWVNIHTIVGAGRFIELPAASR